MENISKSKHLGIIFTLASNQFMIDYNYTKGLDELVNHYQQFLSDTQNRTLESIANKITMKCHTHYKKVLESNSPNPLAQIGGQFDSDILRSVEMLILLFVIIIYFYWLRSLPTYRNNRVRQLGLSVSESLVPLLSSTPPILTNSLVMFTTLLIRPQEYGYNVANRLQSQHVTNSLLFTSISHIIYTFFKDEIDLISPGIFEYIFPNNYIPTVMKFIYRIFIGYTTMVVSKCTTKKIINRKLPSFRYPERSILDLRNPEIIYHALSTPFHRFRDIQSLIRYLSNRVRIHELNEDTLDFYIGIMMTLSLLYTGLQAF